jgi:hypothetical protein
MAALHAFLAHEFGTAWQLYVLCGVYAEEVGMGNDAITLFSAAAKLNQELHEAGSAVATADVADADDAQGVVRLSRCAVKPSQSVALALATKADVQLATRQVHHAALAIPSYCAEGDEAEWNRTNTEHRVALGALTTRKRLHALAVERCRLEGLDGEALAFLEP